MHGIDEWTRRLGVSRRHVENMLAAGDLPRPVRLGRLRRWSNEQIDRWIAERCELAVAGEQHCGRGRPRAGGEK